ncbi:T9SS type A sorting domain-containing protein [Pontibacter qinzhouensis]|uniref:T9SS type A sorting domain-containing protein n=1 Tax=Pontibacter qinzhouensis TaxID=2603253 RepID=A0A5C8KFL9_9BACT|nr:T9SS type A sorting domain-containing protein [Pontibacter qinzhouensis]TXK52822.1 T9SS type A sorting domain-containing protein [Pontibacter qinzhouensis]
MKRILITFSGAFLALSATLCAAQPTMAPSTEKLQAKFVQAAMAHKAEQLANKRLASMRVAQQETQSFWDADEEEWVPTVHYTYTYNTQGFWETVTERALPENELTKRSIDITYDGQGQELQRINQVRTGTAWVNHTRERTEYDAINNMLKLMVTDQWVANTWQLQGGSRHTYTTGAGNRIEQSLTEEYENGAWVNDSKIVYTFSGSGTMPVGSTTSEWQNGAWVETSRTSQIVYENGQMVSAVEEYYDDEEEEWMSSKSTITFSADATKQTATTVITQAMQLGQDWFPVLRLTLTTFTSGETYLGPQNISEIKTEVNMGTSWAIFTHLTTEITRDNDGHITQLIAKNYDEETEEYVNLSRFVYSDFITLNTTSAENEVLAAALQLYPNPTQGNLKIALDPTKVKDASLSIHNLTGQKVYELASVRGEALVDLGQLPSGIYMVRVAGANNAAITRKIVKQ